MPIQETAVSFANICMQFESVLANDNVNLSIREGEVFSLVGENGAGKSTLMNVLYGLLTPTSGQVFVRGKKIDRFSPASAIVLGIGMVHQHFMLVPSFTVAQNITLAREPKKHGLFCDFAKAEQLTKSLCETYGLAVDPKARVRDLGLGMQQRVEILKTLSRGADILILDEPTAVLSPHETDELFRVIRRIVDEKGRTVILITHKLYEVMAISDRVGVMRQGKLVGVHDTKDVSERMLASMMVGSDAFLGTLAKTSQQTTGDVQPVSEGAAIPKAIVLKNVQTFNDRGLPAVKSISFAVQPGEIVGIAGIEGNGQSELIEAITGLRPICGGDVYICGNRINGMHPGQVRQLGLSHIPEDRIATGISKAASVSDNLLSGKQRKRAYAIAGIHLKRRAASEYAQSLYKTYDIRGAGIEAPASSLSGGNMQKLVVAREFSFDTPVLIIAQPTRGVDIGAIEFIHQCIIEKRNAGCAILLISADLDEILRLSDRVLTIYEGCITGEFATEPFDKGEIGYRMTGGNRDD